MGVETKQIVNSGNNQTSKVNNHGEQREVVSTPTIRDDFVYEFNRGSVYIDTKLDKMAPEDTNPQSSHRRTRSTSRSRPTTPLRPSSRSSFRSSARGSVYGDNAAFPLNAFEPAFAELADAVADLEANMMHFQLMHESLARFSESFASFLYGLNMNAFCVDFPEVREGKTWNMGGMVC